ncbi:MAG: ATP-binding protein [Thermodesulfobacteriota bacterium]|nr:ATP-binding protein [Thermodesulfobacteriota bacterium]
MDSKNMEKAKYNLAIVGGGRACSFFLNLIERESFSYLDIEIVGVCDIKPHAQGMILAKKMGIFTTDNFKDLFQIQDLDAVIELTNNKALPDLVAMRPSGVGVVEHNFGRLLRKLFEMNQSLISVKEQAALDRGHYDILFHQANLGVVVLELDFTIVDANKVYLRAVKKEEKDVIGKKCYEVVKGFFAPCPSEEPGFDCPVIKTLETCKSSHIIHEYSLDDKTFYFNIAAYPVMNSQGDVIRVIELWRDITFEMTHQWEKKVQKIEADMKKVIQEDRLVSLGKLVASSVHEINNPIQGLLTFSAIMEEILADDNPDRDAIVECRGYLSHMSRELARCGKIVSGLLAFSRESALEFVNLDINDILDTVLSLTGHKLELSGIELDISLGPSSLIVHGDINQLQQAFLNLIFNAIDAMPKGGRLNISSGLDRDNKKAWVKMADNGCGIGDKDMERIFDPFFTTKEAGEGTGLGLSIVYGIIKDHEGDVKVESRPGQGALFIISFPVVGVD